MRVPGTVWKCEHCGGLRHDDGKCKFCGALEQPYCPPEVPRAPILPFRSKADRAREALRTLRERPNTGLLPPTVRQGFLTIGGNVNANEESYFNVTSCYAMCPEMVLLTKVGGPFLLTNLLFGNQCQLDYNVTMSTDIIDQLGYLELHGDALTCGSRVSVTIKNIGRKGYCYLYLKGPMSG